MNLPNDLKNYIADDSDDPFQLITPDFAVMLLTIGIGFCAFFWPYF